MNNFMILDVTGTQTPTAGGSMWTMVIYLVVIVAFFYFFMVRPQKKQERETAAMRNSLEVGDEITTIGGIIGRITHIKDDVVTIKSGADRNKIRIRKTAIATVDKKVGEAPKGGYKVKKKAPAAPAEAPALKEDPKPEAKTEE